MTADQVTESHHASHPQEPPPMVRLEKLTKRYGPTAAVLDLDLAVQRGEVFGFIGPNGAGKTTTIKMMAGLLAPDGGRVTIAGIDMALHPEAAKQQIGLIPDRPFLYEKLTAMEFLRFTADLYGVASETVIDRSGRLLEMFSLDHRADELIESFSHGMKQRLIMAAALLHHPPLMIVDEPMVGLDPSGIRMVRDLFRQLADEGMTVFMSTHTLKLAEEVCDRIGVIHQGSLAATGNLAELRRAARDGQADLERVFFHLTEENGAQ